MRWAAACTGGVLGFADEVWWSRLAQPTLHTWADKQPLRLEQKARAPTDQAPKALACYGLYLPATQQMQVRFVEKRPVSAATCLFLEWVLVQATAAGRRALFLVWDNASWHISQQVRRWIRTANQQAKREGTCRLIVCQLPVKSPWLNPIEPKWLHAKRAIAEPTRVLTPDELRQRICDYYGCENLAALEQPPC